MRTNDQPQERHPALSNLDARWGHLRCQMFPENARQDGTCQKSSGTPKPESVGGWDNWADWSQFNQFGN